MCVEGLKKTCESHGDTFLHHHEDEPRIMLSQHDELEKRRSSTSSSGNKKNPSSLLILQSVRFSLMMGDVVARCGSSLPQPGSAVRIPLHCHHELQGDYWSSGGEQTVCYGLLLF